MLWLTMLITHTYTNNKNVSLTSKQATKTEQSPGWIGEQKQSDSFLHCKHDHFRYIIYILLKTTLVTNLTVVLTHEQKAKQPDKHKRDEDQLLIKTINSR